MSDTKDRVMQVILAEADVEKGFIPDHAKNKFSDNSGNLKCPFCQQEIKIAGEHTTIMSCFNGDCKGSGLYGEKAFWQELIRTRKALEIAVDALKRLEKELYFNNAKQTGHIADSVISIPSIAIEQITALEQKESAFVHNKIEFPEYNDDLLEEFDKQFFENGQDDDLTETALEQKDVK